MDKMPAGPNGVDKSGFLSPESGRIAPHSVERALYVAQIWPLGATATNFYKVEIQKIHKPGKGNSGSKRETESTELSSKGFVLNVAGHQAGQEVSTALCS